MKPMKQKKGSRNAVSITTGYIINLGIATIAVSIFLVLLQGVFADVTESASEAQISVAGEKLAEEIEKIDRLGNRPGEPPDFLRTRRARSDHRRRRHHRRQRRPLPGRNGRPPRSHRRSRRVGRPPQRRRHPDGPHRRTVQKLGTRPPRRRITARTRGRFWAATRRKNRLSSTTCRVGGTLSRVRCNGRSVAPAAGWVVRRNAGWVVP